VTVIVYYKQLETVQASVQQDRRHSTSGPVLQLDTIAVTMTLHGADHFGPKIYEIRYAGKPAKDAKLPAYGLSYPTSRPARLTPGTWLSELCD
jgi:hypothetical protein